MCHSSLFSTPSPCSNKDSLPPQKKKKKKRRSPSDPRDTPTQIAPHLKCNTAQRPSSKYMYPILFYSCFFFAVYSGSPHQAHTSEFVEIFQPRRPGQTLQAGG